MKETTLFTPQKLLYYTDGFALALLNIKLFSARCEAWVYGSVY